MNEKLIIQNFGGLKSIDINLNKINILIGPQASGKSISVKLLYFFKNFVSDIYTSCENGESKRELDSNKREKFINYFPKESWPTGSFRIEYKLNSSYIIVARENGKRLTLTYSEEYKRLILKGRKIFKDYIDKLEYETPISSYKLKSNIRALFNAHVKKELEVKNVDSQFFIPAGRSFYANLQSNIFSFLSTNQSLDPFLIEFGSFYESFKYLTSEELNFDSEKDRREAKTYKEFDNLISKILNGSFQREKDKDYILHNDNRRVNLINASSGQQEVLPLLIVLKAIHRLSVMNRTGGATLYIEEPEAHLFPTAQQKIVKLLARTVNTHARNVNIVVTTHSPYILSSFNNLLEAGKIVKEKSTLEKEVNKVVPKEEVIDYNDFVAFSINGGGVKNLMDEETKLISQNILDSVSDELAINFGKLLDIEYN